LFCGVLLVGLFGIGKMLLVCVVVGEVGVFFFVLVGLDFVEMFVGVGVKWVCDLFDKVCEVCFVIVFIDEIDVIGWICGSGLVSGVDSECENIFIVMFD